MVIGLVALVAAGLLVFLGTRLLGDDDDDEPAVPVALSESELTGAAGELGPTVYWVGPQPAISEYELTKTDDGRIYIRYLTEGKDAGDPGADFLTVGTYPVPNALTHLQDAEAKGQAKAISKQAGYSVLESASGQSAYVVFDDHPDLEIEIFDPQPGKALELAKSGSLRPLG